MPTRPAPADRLAAVFDYHERTRHLLGRFARSHGRLDWAIQPDPFRRYPSAPTLLLDEVPPGEGPGLDAAWDPGRAAPRSLDRAALSQLLYDSLALSAWKQIGSSRWSLRANPSSGNLHPTEGYLIGRAIPGISDAPFLAHYSPYSHGLEILRTLSDTDVDALFEGLPSESLLVGLTSIHWRESWKYGERAWRYCQLDVGHAACALAAAAALLGWRAGLLGEVPDDLLAALVGVEAQRGPEAEHPDALFALHPEDAPGAPGARDVLAAWRPPEGLAEALAARPHGHAPAPLSADHHDWPIIDSVAEAARRGDDKPASWTPDLAPSELPPRVPDPPARRLVRARRSAQDMDHEATLEAAAFFRLVSALVPATGRQPHAALPWRPAVHPLFFVHRVEGLAPGLYVLPRDTEAEGELRASLLGEFAWERPASAPPPLPFFLLEPGDHQDLARALLCQQEIASDGVFAAVMLAEFEPRLEAEGPWFYRALHWEAGALGQVLYLEAEALGLRGTGIGCFFDAELHRVLGLVGRSWQCLYGFTVGRAVDDPRLSTLPAYPHRSP